MDLPNEITLHILKSLDKSGLKSARLVSRSWSVLAAESLFYEVYVSAHREDLDVFNAITQHPLLSRCVKELLYNTVHFVEIDTEECYFQDLWMQTKYNLEYNRQRPQKTPFPDPEIDAWVNIVESAPDGFNVRTPCDFYQSIRKRCKDYRFIDCGYQRYRRVTALLQHAHSDRGDFFTDLVRGLQKLSNLAHVRMDDMWLLPEDVLDDPDKLSLRRPTGSPTARNWSVFHLCPGRWQWEPQNYNESDNASKATDITNHYWTITCALIRSQKAIQSLDTGFFNRIPPCVFNRSQGKALSFYGLDIFAFSGLKNLDLYVKDYGDEQTLGLYPSIDGLRLLLCSMHHLEFLALDFPVPAGATGQMPYRCNQVLSLEGRWNHLTFLKLDGFASSATDFLTLLTQATPNLDRLWIGMIELLSSTWEGVFECMMQSMHLSDLRIDSCSALWHCGGDDFVTWEDMSFPEAIENYVMYGGRHPCLLSGQSDSTAEEFITEDLRQFYKPSRTT